jgi:O-acetylserine/cysteine efflux transporter
VAAIWGTNFVAIKISYESFTPFVLLTLRFILTVLPLIFIVPRPNCSWKLLVNVALFLWMGQFVFTFFAIYFGMPPGLCSLVLQIQTIFTIILTAIFHQYRPSILEMAGIIVAFSGIALIGLQIEGDKVFLGFIFMIISAFSVSIANLLFKGHTNLNMLSVVVWSSLIPPIPLFLLSLIFEGAMAIPVSFSKLTLDASLCLLYTAYFSTIIAASLWTYLLRIYEPSKVVPFSFMVPVFGIGSSCLILGETFSFRLAIASILVIAGLIINQISGRMKLLKLYKSVDIKK